MKKFVDLLFKSMIEHDPSILPLADRYAATENSHAAALHAMTSWRTITGVNCIGHLVIDKQDGSIFVTASLDENGSPTIFNGRLKIENELIAELEINLIRSRGDSGFVYLPEEMDKHHNGWTSPIPEDGRATREELLAIGKAIFDASSKVEYEASPDCILEEVGGIVYEDPDYLETLQGDEGNNGSSGPREKVTIPAGLWPMRPQDPNARVIAVDEEQGIVVSTAQIPGYVCPYVVSNETGACFVPECMIEMHNKTLNIESFKGKKVLKQMPATGTTIEILRFHSGKIQAMHRYINLQGPGAISPWVTK
ncbi:hypothetical protein M2651_09375 [Clostridium sp. SYSU_GA19001]|uniref:hypothetical protein n=1 Tax=Clostridium caldaquaticum TaxID=2940653 RepID=UPI0020773F49|nr:hypothetical protein [Clostridium caldaquaticum]MCM8711239.1 hypothetical protein [Clostridium caldaquaticum]